MSSSDCVQVAVRVRPLVDSETNKGCQDIVRKSKNEPQIIIGEGRNNEVFTFNHVFSSEMPQETVYTDAIGGLLDKLFKGKF
jgi:kinesin family member 4